MRRNAEKELYHVSASVKHMDDVLPGSGTQVMKELQESGVINSLQNQIKKKAAKGESTDAAWKVLGKQIAKTVANVIYGTTVSHLGPQFAAAAQRDPEHLTMLQKRRKELEDNFYTSWSDQ
jgi:hypothetical protein